MNKLISGAEIKCMIIDMLMETNTKTHDYRQIMTDISRAKNIDGEVKGESYYYNEKDVVTYLDDLKIKLEKEFEKND